MEIKTQKDEIKTKRGTDIQKWFHKAEIPAADSKSRERRERIRFDYLRKARSEERAKKAKGKKYCKWEKGRRTNKCKLLTQQTQKFQREERESV